MRRRLVSAALLSAATSLPRRALAQLPAADAMARIGWLAGSAGPLPTPAYLEALRAGLRELGWQEGRNLRIDER